MERNSIHVSLGAGGPLDKDLVIIGAVQGVPPTHIKLFQRLETTSSVKTHSLVVQLSC